MEDPSRSHVHGALILGTIELLWNSILADFAAADSGETE
jgi:hypothetical protein